MKLISSLALLFSTTTFAGGFVGGGGMLIKDTNNPWFVQNTEVIKYCIEVDESSFHHGNVDLDDAITKALTYWKVEFKNSWNRSYSFGRVEVATQQFVRENCSTNTDLRFQFGYLSGDQIKKIGDPTEYVATTFREQYDTKNLRGKGFIYIGADSGALKFDSEDLVFQRPWQAGNGGLLVFSLIHELGHVFGIPHTLGAGFVYGIMEADSIEMVMRDKAWAEYISKYPNNIEHFFKFSGGLLHVECFKGELPKTTREFFGIPDQWQCMQIIQADSSNSYFVKGAKTHEEYLENKLTNFGKIIIERTEQRPEPVVNIYFPKDQNVFKFEPGTLPPKILGPGVINLLEKGYFTPTGRSSNQPIFMKVMPRGQYPEMGGILNGKLELNILY